MRVFRMSILSLVFVVSNFDTRDLKHCASSLRGFLVDRQCRRIA